MWIFTRDGGFISVVAHKDNPALVRVRARRREHLEWSFPTATIIDMDPPADYRWHAEVPRTDLVVFLSDAVTDLEYTSHVKEYVAGDDNQFYSAMLRCWSALLTMQTGGNPWAWDDDKYDDYLDALAETAVPS